MGTIAQSFHPVFGSVHSNNPKIQRHNQCLANITTEIDKLFRTTLDVNFGQNVADNLKSSVSASAIRVLASSVKSHIKASVS